MLFLCFFSSLLLIGFSYFSSGLFTSVLLLWSLLWFHRCLTQIILDHQLSKDRFSLSLSVSLDINVLHWSSLKHWRLLEQKYWGKDWICTHLMIHLLLFLSDNMCFVQSKVTVECLSLEKQQDFSCRDFLWRYIHVLAALWIHVHIALCGYGCYQTSGYYFQLFTKLTGELDWCICAHVQSVCAQTDQ